MTLSILPIVLGEGRRLFTGGETETRLVLDSCRSWPSGLAQLSYLVQRVPSPGMHAKALEI